jgi:large subunit ribosomal protein L13
MGSSALIPKTTLIKPGTAQQAWHLANADGQILGRMAAKLARVLMGKHRPDYTPHADMGDFIVVLNAEKIGVTGNKLAQKTYDRYSFYPGGRKITSLEEMMDRHPERVIQLAVRRMLPRNKIGRNMLKRLKIFRGDEHPHQAQRPQPMAL